ncbi:MAG: hypothetical protein IJS65_07225 [Clostridia bacterium]|nr:hypothetical protein [Clostridia bacterium]
MVAATRESTARRLNERETEIKSIEGGRYGKKAGTPYFKYAFIALCIFAALTVIIFENMKVTELSTQNSRLKSEITELNENAKMLNARIERKYNLSYVEDYAKNVLGMVKLDKDDIKYVELSNADRITVREPEENTSELVQGISKSFNIVLEYLN